MAQDNVSEADVAVESQQVEFELSITVTTTANQDDQQLEFIPNFRWKFLNLEKPTTTDSLNPQSKEWILQEKDNPGDNDDGEFCKTFKNVVKYADVTVDEQLAQFLDQNPITYVIMGSTSATDASQKNPYAGIFSLDVSALLSEDLTSVSNTWTNTETSSSSSSYSLSSAIPVCEKAMPNVTSISVTLSASVPILVPALRTKLNPMSITLGSISNLPGVTITSRTLSEHVLPTPYRLLATKCEPLYAVIHLYNNRSVRTPGVLQNREKVCFKYTTTILTSTQQDQVVENIANSLVTIELHDRDLLHSKMVLEKFNQMAQDGVPLSECDEEVIPEISSTNAGDSYAHGVASFSLSELLNTATQVSDSFRAASRVDETMRCKLTSEVLPHKQRVFNDDDDDSLLDQADKLVRAPGSYLDSQTRIKIQATLSHLIDNRNNTKPIFTRMAFICGYSNLEFLRRLLEAIDIVNHKAFPNEPLRSLQLTPEQVEAANSGELDIITGFTVIDFYNRIIIIEGLANGGMKSVANAMTRTSANDANLTTLMNDTVLFTKRLYTAFDVDLKKIKLRDPLPVLIKMPEIYNRSKVSASCFTAINQLRDIRKSRWLADLRNLFPTVKSLLEIESKYGESITMQDIDGSVTLSKKPKVLLLETTETTDSVSPKKKAKNATRRRVRPSGRSFKLKAPTDSTNVAFTLSKKEKRTRNYLDEIAQIKQSVAEKYKADKEAYAAEHPETDEVIYNYSGQKLQNSEAAKAVMRDRLATDKSASYTYSTEFQSLAMCMVDEDRIAQDAESDSRKKWTTTRGFVYPAPRKSSDFIKHPKAPSAQRREELKERWIENVNHPAPVSRADNNNQSGKPNFDTIPSHSMTFGGTNSDGTVNADYFKSVHLVGDGMEAEMEAARLKEQKDWEDKLVVSRDEIHFRAHHARPPDKVSAINRTKDILAGDVVKSKALRIVRNASLPSGKRNRLVQPPVTIMADDEFRESSEFLKNMRDDDPLKFTSDKKFLLQLPTHSKKVVHTRRILPMTAGETLNDPRWRVLNK